MEINWNKTSHPVYPALNNLPPFLSHQSPTRFRNSGFVLIFSTSTQADTVLPQRMAQRYIIPEEENKKITGKLGTDIEMQTFKTNVKLTTCNSCCDAYIYIYIYISYLSHSVYMERILPVRFSSRPGKAGSRFAQPGSLLKRDNFYHINTPSCFAGTILC